MNTWIDIALYLLEKTLKPVPIEINELDWKSDLSTKNERLAQHISAFANNPGGGFLVFGINNIGEINPLSQEEMDNII